jgi:glycosyltransferase involved in cell wall biosynthesis
MLYGASDESVSWKSRYQQLRDMNARPGDPVRVLIFVEAAAINGVAKSVLNFCDGLGPAKKLGIHLPFAIHVALFQRGKLKNPNPFSEALRRRKIPLHVIPERCRFDFGVLAAISELIREIDPDIIQTNSVKSHFLVKTTGIHQRRHWIAFHHGYTAPDLKMRVYNRFDCWSLRSAERVVIPCQAFQQEMLARGVEASRIRVIYNAACEMPIAPVEDVVQLRQRLDWDDDTKVILSIGRLSFEKAHVHVVRAVRRLRDMRPDLKCKLVIVGQGPQVSRIRAAIKELGLEASVRVLCREPDVVPFYALADVFVLPSLSEGSPNVILEAMASGVPIVATSVGGIPEILRHEDTAILVPPKGDATLAAAIERLLQSPGLARTLIRNARTAARTSFALETYARNIAETYFEVLPMPRAELSCAPTWNGALHNEAQADRIQ